ncbi:hypothetical protein BB561_001121 [Smittium simulii]|uniref:Mannose-6-phosphate isomerase n=1 Tax=Smittium simulii TaxID=133385 RepID=A0A2T9YW01_9FUNG|nr:hypothetical protein BB561_001121 [Smittium simulii]
MTVTQIVRLSCAPNHYHWGKVGKASKVALLAISDPDFSFDSNKHYSELWMGTHPNGMSFTFDNKQLSLEEFIEADPKAILGQNIAEKYNNKLPFLYKVLSVETALSIQAHPGKKLAQRLHKAFPDLYKDPNHKPEMAIAISDFEALSGFRPLEDIIAFLTDFPELSSLLGSEVSKEFIQTATSDSATIKEKQAALKAIFSILMKKDPESIKEQLSALIKRTQPLLASNSDPVLHTVHKLNIQYPNDVGVFCVFFLNLIHLKPGEGFFMGANEPHAYLYGDCVECMATSDNVVRAGLTPKFRDVDTLVDMVHYFYGPAKEKIFSPKPWKNGPDAPESKYTMFYNPNIEEFSMVMSRLPSDASDELVIGGPSILTVTDGSGSITSLSKTFDLKTGYTYFIPANTTFTVSTGSNEILTTYTAFCDDKKSSSY